MPTERGMRVLRMIADLEFGSEAYAVPSRSPTDFELGFVNFTQARWLAIDGCLVYPEMGQPLRLTEAAREYLRKADQC